MTLNPLDGLNPLGFGDGVVAGEEFCSSATVNDFDGSKGTIVPRN